MGSMLPYIAYMDPMGYGSKRFINLPPFNWMISIRDAHLTGVWCKIISLPQTGWFQIHNITHFDPFCGSILHSVSDGEANRYEKIHYLDRPWGYLTVVTFFVLFHFRAAFTMGEKVGVTFPSSWGA